VNPDFNPKVAGSIPAQLLRFAGLLSDAAACPSGSSRLQLHALNCGSLQLVAARAMGSSVPSTVENSRSDRLSSWCEGIDASDQDEGGGNSDADSDEGVTEAKAATEQCEGRSHRAQEKGYPHPPHSPPSDCSLDVHSAAELPGEGGQLAERQ